MDENTKITPLPTLPAISMAHAQQLIAPEVTNLLAVGTRARPGQPTKRTEAVIEEIVISIACGQSLRAVCQRPDMPGYSTVMKWQMDDPSLVEQFDLAYEYHARTLDDIAEDILAGGPSSTGDFRRDEARVAHLRYRLGKLHRRRFGDKVQIEHSVQPLFVMPSDAIEGDGY
ncbi:hypothetical protein [Sphingomonas sp. G-3-2-10]|uniref:terminase small subunit-like protein n=1 Tax=Sphingomonas sp. G-3-2-10 TaxID=2728838 RepID=UPI00146B62B0|nr:hypothetical protein [Sphingomonas sp. G-3-2-10]NML04287.1 hypothetical protein [Sphingomonas sp. G-3-2-10]